MDKNKRRTYIINAIAIIALYLAFFILIQTKTMNKYLIGIAILTCIMIIMAMSLNIVAGFLGEMASSWQ